MARLTVADLQQMKRDGKKIAAAVVYEFEMARICEKAGADLLSVGDSLGRALLAMPDPDDMTKMDVRGHEDTAAEMVRAVVETGLAAYPHVGYYGGPRSDGLHGTPEDHENMMKWTRTLYEAGASMIDLASVTTEIYADVCNSLPIPVIGGQTGPEADGHIHVAWGLIGYRADAIDRTDPPSASKLAYDLAQKAFGDIHAGTWRGGMHNPI